MLGATIECADANILFGPSLLLLITVHIHAPCVARTEQYCLSCLVYLSALISQKGNQTKPNLGHLIEAVINWIKKVKVLGGKVGE